MAAPGSFVATKKLRWHRTADVAAGRVYQADVSDGKLYAILSKDVCDVRGIMRPLVHLSVSFRDKQDRLTRCPTWDELKHAKFSLVQEDVAMVLIFPRKSDPYIDHHPTTLHLWESVDPDIGTN